MEHYINIDGNYLGEFEKPPEDSYKVPIPPKDQTDTWSGAEWITYEDMRPRPDLLINLILSDPDLPVQIVPFLAPIRVGGDNKALRQSVWTKLKQSLPEWLTEEYQEKLKKWASECYMPLE